jgi:hypothetical protein
MGKLESPLISGLKTIDKNFHPTVTSSKVRQLLLVTFGKGSRNEPISLSICLEESPGRDLSIAQEGEAMRRPVFHHIHAIRFFQLLICIALLGLQSKAAAQGLENPSPLILGTTVKVDLFDHEQNYLKISFPTGQFKVILDARRADGQVGNMMAGLSILSSDGINAKRNVISFDEIDKVHRGVHTFGLKSPATLILQLSNELDRQIFWLTVLKDPSPTLPPFFNELTPKSLTLGQPELGTLESNEYAYYTAKLSRGDYKVTLDFELPTKERNNLTGYFATLDENGGNQKDYLISTSSMSFPEKPEPSRFARRPSWSSGSREGSTR